MRIQKTVLIEDKKIKFIVTEKKYFCKVRLTSKNWAETISINYTFYSTLNCYKAMRKAILKYEACMFKAN
jgi:hypothetical protein